jgi:hypothetical protein
MAMLFDVFDQQLEQLTTVAERVCGVLRQEGIEYRIVGGLAVLFHVEPRDPFGARLTKDVDLAVNRADLARIAAAVRSLGLEHQQAAGLDRLVNPAAPNRRGVHLLFVKEKVRSGDLLATPDFSEPTKTIEGFLLAPVPDLVRMKLTSFRLKDKTHIIDMDSVGLITPEIEAGLPDALRKRPEQVRAEERGA